MRARDTTHSKQMRANTCKQAHAAAQAETVLSQRPHRECFSTSHFLRSTSYVVETLHVAPFKLRLHVVATHLWFQVSVRGATRRNQLARLVEACEDSHHHGEIVKLAILQSMHQFVRVRVPDLHPERLPPA